MSKNRWDYFFTSRQWPSVAGYDVQPHSKDFASIRAWLESPIPEVECADVSHILKELSQHIKHKQEDLEPYSKPQLPPSIKSPITEKKSNQSISSPHIQSSPPKISQSSNYNRSPSIQRDLDTSEYSEEYESKSKPSTHTKEGKETSISPMSPFSFSTLVVSHAKKSGISKPITPKQPSISPPKLHLSPPKPIKKDGEHDSSSSSPVFPRDDMLLSTSMLSTDSSMREREPSSSGKAFDSPKSTIFPITPKQPSISPPKLHLSPPKPIKKDGEHDSSSSSPVFPRDDMLLSTSMLSTDSSMREREPSSSGKAFDSPKSTIFVKRHSPWKMSQGSDFDSPSSQSSPNSFLISSPSLFTSSLDESDPKLCEQTSSTSKSKESSSSCSPIPFGDSFNFIDIQRNGHFDVYKSDYKTEYESESPKHHRKQQQRRDTTSHHHPIVMRDRCVCQYVSTISSSCQTISCTNLTSSLAIIPAASIQTDILDCAGLLIEDVDMMSADTIFNKLDGTTTSAYFNDCGLDNSTMNSLFTELSKYTPNLQSLSLGDNPSLILINLQSNFPSLKSLSLAQSSASSLPDLWFDTGNNINYLDITNCSDITFSTSFLPNTSSFTIVGGSDDCVAGVLDELQSTVTQLTIHEIDDSGGCGGIMSSQKFDDNLEELSITFASGKGLCLYSLENLEYPKLVSLTLINSPMKGFQTDLSSITPSLEYLEIIYSTSYSSFPVTFDSLPSTLETLILQGLYNLALSSLFIDSVQVDNIKTIRIRDSTITDELTTPIQQIIETMEFTNVVLSPVIPDENIQSFFGRFVYNLEITNSTSLSVNSISEIEFLTSLSILNNNISDISPLFGLQYLETVDLSDNIIYDFTPLFTHKQISSLEFSNNYMCYVEDSSDISSLLTFSNERMFPNLETSPISVEIDANQCMDNQCVSSFTSCPSIFENEIYSTSTSLACAFVSTEDTDTDTCQLISCPFVRGKILELLGKDDSYFITFADIRAQLTGTLDLSDISDSITTLRGLEFATSLTGLVLDDYDLSQSKEDRDIVKSLTRPVINSSGSMIYASLTSLSLARCNIDMLEDVIEFSTLGLLKKNGSSYPIALESLDVRGNNLSDISVLITSLRSPMTTLTYLNVDENMICDIESLRSPSGPFLNGTALSTFSSYSQEQCPCYPAFPVWNLHSVCRKLINSNAPVLYQMECMYGYYLDKDSNECVQYTSTTLLECQTACHDDDHGVGGGYMLGSPLKRCVYSGSEMICENRNGYNYLFTANSCPSNDSTICGVFATCDTSTFICQCPPSSYVNDSGYCTSEIGCTDCSSDSVCARLSDGSFECQCAEGSFFNGITCIEDSSYCGKIGDDFCGIHGECLSSSCVCSEGWSNSLCEIGCELIDGKVCSGSDKGTCTSTTSPGYYDTCECTNDANGYQLYEGDNCEYIYVPDPVLHAAICSLSFSITTCNILPAFMDFTELTGITGDISTFQGLQLATSLQTLSITGSNSSEVSLTTTDFSLFLPISSLTTLELDSVSMDSDVSLASLINLTSLSLKNYNLDSFSVGDDGFDIADLSIVSLNLDGNSFSSIPDLTGLTELENLSLGSISLSGVEDVNALLVSNIPYSSIVSLDLTSAVFPVDTLIDFSSFSVMTSLNLNLSNSSRIDISSTQLDGSTFSSNASSFTELHIDNITNFSYLGNFDSLKKLSMRNCGFTVVPGTNSAPALHSSVMPILSYLDMADNDMSSLSTDYPFGEAFEAFAAIEYLDMSRCHFPKLFSLPSHVSTLILDDPFANDHETFLFSSAPNLETLYLANTEYVRNISFADTKLTDLSHISSAVKENIISLYLNGVSAFDDDDALTLSSFSNLINVDLSATAVTKFPPNLPSSVASLTMTDLSLSYTDIDEFYENIQALPSGIESIDLTNSTISVSIADALLDFSHLPNLESISFGTKISISRINLSNTSFTDLTKLTGEASLNSSLVELHLDGVSLTSNLDSFSSLVKLSLRGCGLTSFPTLNSLVGDSLEFLDLGNDSDDANKNVFSCSSSFFDMEFSNLSYLDLSYTSLDCDIVEIITSPIISLVEYRGIGNLISTIDTLNFSNFKSLSTFDLSNNSSLEDLFLTDTSVSDLSQFDSISTQLTYLSLLNCPNINDTNAEDLNSFTNLTSLFISEANLTSIPDLSSLTKLTSFALESVASFTAVSTGEFTTTLDLLSKTLENISFSWTNLDFLINGLDLSKFSELSSLSVLGTGVKILDVSDTKLVNLLADFSSLEELYLDNVSTFTSYDFSNYLVLTVLSLENCGLTSMPTLYTSIEDLYLGKNELTIIDILTLNDLVNLNVLDLSDNSSITDITPLFDDLDFDIQKRLTELYFQGNELDSSITALNFDDFRELSILRLTSQSLESLDLQGTKISDITQMGDCFDSILDLKVGAISSASQSFLSSLSSLTSLSLLSTEMEVFPDLSNLGLISIFLDTCSLDDSISSVLTSLSNTLEEISIVDLTYDSTIANSSSLSFSKFQSLSFLELEGLSSITELDLSDCTAMQNLEVSGDVVDQLTLLNVSNIELNSGVLVQFANLTTLIAKNCGFVDFPELSTTSLEVLNVSNNEDLNEFLDCSDASNSCGSFTSVNIAHTDISSIIPLCSRENDGITTCSQAPISLESLDISGLSISPSELMYFTLDSLTAVSCLFVEYSLWSIPTSVLKLDLRDNELNDISPLLRLSSLTELYLDGNRICGILESDDPTDFQDNELTASSSILSSFLSNMSSLSTLDQDSSLCDCPSSGFQLNSICRTVWFGSSDQSVTRFDCMKAFMRNYGEEENQGHLVCDEIPTLTSEMVELFANDEENHWQAVVKDDISQINLTCIEGWYGNDCDIQCDNNCSYHGVCNLDNHVCVCEIGYGTFSCEEQQCSDTTCSTLTTGQCVYADAEALYPSHAWVCSCPTNEYNDVNDDLIPCCTSYCNSGLGCGNIDTSDSNVSSLHCLPFQTVYGVVDPSHEADWTCGCELNWYLSLDDSYYLTDVCLDGTEYCDCIQDQGSCVSDFFDSSIIKCECYSDINGDYVWFGSDCSADCPTDENDVICGGHGQCDSDTHVCDCSYDSYLDQTSGICIAPSECYGCSEHGKCTLGDDDVASCVCTEGWYYDTCTSECPVNDAGVLCSDHGDCGNDHLCACDVGWGSENCSVQYCSDSSCGGSGECFIVQYEPYSWSCSCDESFQSVLVDPSSSTFHCQSRCNNGLDCSIYGDCVQSSEAPTDTWECSCLSTAYLDEVSGYCVDASGEDNACEGCVEGHGQCVLMPDGVEVTCQCFEDESGSPIWFDPTCSSFCPINDVSDSFEYEIMCSGFSCDPSTHLCDCGDEYYGDACEYVYFSDFYLQIALCEVLGKNSACDLTSADLARLPSTLDLSDNVLITGALSPLSHGTKVTEINLSNCTSLSNINGIGAVLNLISLDLSGCTSLIDASSLSSSPLESLNLSYSGVTDISVLNGYYLNYLDLSGIQLSSELSADLATLSNLSSLILHDCALQTIPDICNLASELTFLDLSGNNLRNTDGLQCLTYLESLDLSYNRIYDLYSLSNLHYLQSIDISHNYILDLISLYELNGTLTTLDLENNLLGGGVSSADLALKFPTTTSSSSSPQNSGVIVGDQTTMYTTSLGIECPNPVLNSMICRVIGVEPDGDLIIDLECAADSVRIVSSQSITCETPAFNSDVSLLETCVNPQKECVGVYNDEFSMKVRCFRGWYGDSCDSACPTDIDGLICAGYDCLEDSHSCECPEGLTGELCSFEDVALDLYEEIDSSFIDLLCENIPNVECDDSQDSSISKSMLVSDVTDLKSLVIPSNVLSIEGIQFCEQLELLIFEDGSLITDFSPISNLRKLVTIVFPGDITISSIKSLYSGVVSLKETIMSSIYDYYQLNCVGLCSLQGIFMSGCLSIDSMSDLNEILSWTNLFSQCIGSECIQTNYNPMVESLTTLDISYCPISDPSLLFLHSSLQNLVSLDFSNSNISDMSLVSSVMTTLPIYRINLDQNYLPCDDTDDCRSLLELKIGESVDNLQWSASSQRSMSCGENQEMPCDYSTDYRVCSSWNGTEESCTCEGNAFFDEIENDCVVSDSCSLCGGERGLCVSDGDIQYCECYADWYGDDCSSPCPIYESVQCNQPHGICGSISHSCLCDINYVGSACQLYCNDFDTCGGNGNCSVEIVTTTSGEVEVSSCSCNSGWFGAYCEYPYPVESIYSEDLSVFIDYVCGKDYSDDSTEGSSYQEYAETTTGTCDCSSHGLATDALTGICLDPASHPEYRDVDGNDTACMNCGSEEGSYAECIIDGTSRTATCECDYGWGNESLSDLESVNSTIEKKCSVDVCLVGIGTETIEYDGLCSSHGICTYLSDSSEYFCLCEDGWNGVSCSQPDDAPVGLIILIILTIISVLFALFGLILWFVEKRKGDKTGHDSSQFRPRNVKGDVIKQEKDIQELVWGNDLSFHLQERSSDGFTHPSRQVHVIHDDSEASGGQFDSFSESRFVSRISPVPIPIIDPHSSDHSHSSSLETSSTAFSEPKTETLKVKIMKRKKISKKSKKSHKISSKTFLQPLSVSQTQKKKKNRKKKDNV
ncbi:hypothetical protein ADUPG1_007659 [Aduncisulcus paluster]|uniref:EGF-like domain-containing protein n=1 Tax=Aduncisulcus paluster TaxID=2918883 RepID=A0ABQ5KTE5_9EUKA|nr:hypothetical protein ADUPG1_007659 [Aduncisulcus paluster]